MISSTQKKNLAKLADYLENLPAAYPRFNMRYYNSDDTGVARSVQEDCGSVACAVGHGPDAGFPPLEDESWRNYCTRVFAKHSGRLWGWCFDGMWSYRDNTAKGAAARIRWALKHMWLFGDGVPLNWKSQLNGSEPLCYVKTSS